MDFFLVLLLASSGDELQGIKKGIMELADAIVINKAAAVFTVSGYTGTYDGLPHGASVGTITGVNGESGATVGSINLGSSFTNVPGGTANWNFTNANYADQSGSATSAPAIAPSSARIRAAPGLRSPANNTAMPAKSGSR